MQVVFDPDSSLVSSSSLAEESMSWHAPALATAAAIAAVVATIPFAAVIAAPIRSLVEAAPGSPGSATGLAFLLVGPLGYLLFVATTWAVLNEQRRSRWFDQAGLASAAFAHTMRVAAMGLGCYVILTLAGLGWQAGPRLPLVVAGSLTLPVGMVATIWASAQGE